MDRSAWESRYHLLDTNSIERAVPTLAGACEVQMTITLSTCQRKQQTEDCGSCNK